MSKLLRAMPGLKERAKTLVELMKGTAVPVCPAAVGHGREGHADHQGRRRGRTAGPHSGAEPS